MAKEAIVQTRVGYLARMGVFNLNYHALKEAIEDAADRGDFETRKRLEDQLRKLCEKHGVDITSTV